RQLGLANEDKHLEKKKEALKVVLDVNRFIRREARQLEAKGVTLATPGGNFVEPVFEATSGESLAAATPAEPPVAATPAEPPPKVKAPGTPPAEEVREPVPIAAATMEWSLDRSTA
ncbi:MAG TPA: hypothetical protein VMU54_05355, partial [Planctomycetota bacterium]|nr:hypothetical protein [Planctomycetota bacterium]